MGIRVVLHDHQRVGELLAGSIEEVGVAGFGEAFALVFATRAALVHAAAALVTPSRGPLP